MPLISVFVSSPDTHSERRFDTGLTVQQLKDKLVPITGISPQHQVVRVFRSSEQNELVASLDDENRTLENYGLQEWNVIKVDSSDPNARPGEFSDLSAVEKFELTPEEYEARSDTVLSHLKANKLGRFAPTPTNLTHAPPPPSSVPSNIVVGARCQVPGDGGLERRGTVRYVGTAPIGKGGAWVGVELDEPVGKGDGEIEGVRYFTSRAKHAVFVRPDKVDVGDYPEEDLMGSDDEI
ncbi:tubulin-folding cofactor B [Papiliotrema laurentii]|uniref:Tubulin-folding cofactor B n=1 Tax=Papiliotrema laurentii TaxID=5418 RepID=A0AAD9L6F0_PAPLA|nr:tubulin-folding cofactor B [Papiliotrema laurentii]